MSTDTTRVDGTLPLRNYVSPEIFPADQDAIPQGYRLPDDCTDPSLIQRYIAAQMGRTEDDFIEFGRALVALKALIPHGEFSARLKDSGISPSTASKLMSAFRRLKNATGILEVVKVRGKAFELLPLEDAQIKELAVTGKTGTLVLSEIMSMTVKAMRETVKRCRDERCKAVARGAMIEVEARLNAALAIQPGDRIESLHACRSGAVVKVYADGSCCVRWDDGEPQEAGLGHERMPRNLLVKMTAVAAPAKGGVNAAFETTADTAATPFNDGQPAAQGEAAQADTANLRRVDAQLKVYFGGRVFDVAQGGFGVGDDVVCEPAERGPFIQVRRPDAAGAAYMAPMVRPVDAAPAGAPFTRVVCQGMVVHYRNMVFDVSGAGVEFGEVVSCVADDDGLSLWVRRLGSDAPAIRAPFVRKVFVQFVKPYEATAEPDDATKTPHGVSGPAGDGRPPAQAPDPSVLRRKQYLADRMKVVLCYADGLELNGIEDMLEELVNDISRGRYVPGLVAADYDLTRKYWIEGSAQ